jgi:hypothetical protein
VRLPILLDSGLFPDAELSALRLDGDCFPVGPAAVPADSAVDAAVRAAVLAGEAARYGLVAADRAAAWVHGAISRPPNPVRFSVDLAAGVRTRTPPVPPREVRFQRCDLTVIAGLRLTTPLRTALDLARLEERFDPSTAATVGHLLSLAAVSPAAAAQLLAAAPPAPDKRRGIRRLRALGAAEPPPWTGAPAVAGRIGPPGAQ